MHPSSSTSSQHGGHRGALLSRPGIVHAQPPFPVTGTQGEAAAAAGPSCTLSTDSDTHPTTACSRPSHAVQAPRDLGPLTSPASLVPPSSRPRHLDVWTDAETEESRQGFPLSSTWAEILAPALQLRSNISVLIPSGTLLTSSWEQCGLNPLTCSKPLAKSLPGVGLSKCKLSSPGTRYKRRKDGPASAVWLGG